MSDFRALGGVSASLQTLLRDRMELPDWVDSAPITFGPPPFLAKDDAPRKEEARVNLFLYRVSQNGHLQNQDIPGRGAPGAYGHPPLSLNLHYLLTAYGNDENRQDGETAMFDDLTAHELLGSAMRVFHDVPVLTERLTTQRAPSGQPVLHLSLRDAFEQVKLTLEPLTLEDITKVWSALVLRYRLSAAYVVNVVQIESRRERRYPRPVGQPASATVPPLPSDPVGPGPMVYVLTIQTPTITALTVRSALTASELAYPYARVRDTLVLRGTALAGPRTNVLIDDLMVPVTVAGPEQVEAIIPDADIAGVGTLPPDRRLQPGVHTASVIVSEPLIPGRTFRSNSVAFMLVPSVDASNLVYTSGPPRTLMIPGTRLLGPAPSCAVLIGRAAVGRSTYLTANADQLVVPIPDELPARDVTVLVGQGLPRSVPLTAGPQRLEVTIGGTTKSIVANLTSPIDRDGVAGVLATLIHDAAPEDVGFAGARVDLWGDRLVVVPGALLSPVTITSPVGDLAGDFGLSGPQLLGAANAFLSGALGSPPQLSARSPRVQLTIGGQPPVVLTIAPVASLAALADDLQRTIRAASTSTEFASALVGLSGSQLLVVPGAPRRVRFTAAAGDDRTVVELQLQAKFAVRVRANGAESIDEAFVELPQ